MKRIPLLLLSTLLLISNFGWASSIEWKAVSVNSVDSKKTPYSGVLKRALSYTDVDGAHLVLLSQQDKSSPSNGSSKRIEYHELLAISFIFANGNWNVEWSVKDNVDCPGLDSEMEFFYDQVLVEDANNDQIAEVYLPYHYFCGGGLDPSAVKIIMRTDHLKFAVRGESTILIKGQNSYGGSVKFDKSLDDPKYKLFKERIFSIWKIISVERH